MKPIFMTACCVGLTWTMMLAGCRSTLAGGDEPVVIFASVSAEGREYFRQSASAALPPLPIPALKSAGNLQTAPRAGLGAATFGGAVPSSAELRLVPLADAEIGDRATVPAEGRVLVHEWAWDFSLRETGDAIAWIAGRERRQLFVARAPTWRPVVVPLSPEAVPGEPRWLDAQRLLVVLRHAGRNDLAVVEPASGTMKIVVRASPGVTLGDACRVLGSSDVLVIESLESGAPGRLLRVSETGGEPRVLVTGFFAARTLTVSPDGRFIAVVWSADLSVVQRREASLRWVGAAWRGTPTALAGVRSLEWSPDGTLLAVARQVDGRQMIEVYSDGGEGVPRELGFGEAVCVTPQWVQARR